MSPEHVKKGQQKYWEDVRAGRRPSPRQVYAENKKKKEEVAEKHLNNISDLESRIEQLKTELAELERYKVYSEYSMAITGKHMASREMILQKADHYLEKCGIYFLINDDTIQYVGQSVSIFSRLRAHEMEGRIKFNRMAWVECSKENLNIVESLYIHMFNPPCNGMNTYSGKTAPMSMEQIFKLIVKEKETV